MYAGEYKLVADRLVEIFRAAPPARAKPPLTPPVADISGDWDAEVEFVVGSAEHEFHFDVHGNELGGNHTGRITHGPIEGTIDGADVRFRASGPYEGTSIRYRFSGLLEGDEMSGVVDLGEYGTGSWRARRRA